MPLTNEICLTRTTACAAVLLIAGGLAVAGCSDDGGAGTTTTTPTGGQPGTPTGSGGSDTGSGGSAPASGGSDTGSGGSAPASGGAGPTGGAAPDIWPGPYNPAGAPDPAEGYHIGTAETTTACLTCHAAAVSVTLGGGFAHVFAGTVYQADGVTPAANVEVIVSDGTNTLTNYSGGNGTFWVDDAGTVINWAAVDVRIRNANGEKIKSKVDATEADCNSCHATGGEATVLKAP